MCYYFCIFGYIFCWMIIVIDGSLDIMVYWYIVILVYKYLGGLVCYPCGSLVF